MRSELLEKYVIIHKATWLSMVAQLLVTASSLGSNPDIPQKS